MKKKINIALIIVVLGLWGTVVSKALNQYFFSEELVMNTAQSERRLNPAQINKDTFLLEKITRDPFLNKREGPVPQFKRSYSKSPKTIPMPIKPVVPKVMQPFPFVGYYGYIKSKDKKEELILVKIDKKLHKLRRNDQVNGLIIKNVYKDSIEVNFNNAKKIIRIN